MTSPSQDPNTSLLERQNVVEAIIKAIREAHQKGLSLDEQVIAAHSAVTAAIPGIPSESLNRLISTLAVWTVFD